uniref:EamA family transporter n=2 Tax=Yoonia sp. TaxID=2212373 RepID=UPI0040480BDE|tara:strand:- start:3283 stop:4119 length:837 start_codon:yes stop_codon:yes gene_type:complete
MTIWVLAAVLGAAFLHALWNALIKLGTSKLTSMLILTLVQGGMGLLVALTRPFPDPQVWLWLLASGVFHAAYKLFLAFAYEQGDLSRVYPIARGAAPMLVLVISALLLPDVIAAWEYIGILVLGSGILLMARGVFSSGESRRLVPLALGSAMATAGYSLVDGLGARASGDAVAYVGWLFTLDAVFFTPVCIALRGKSVLRASGKVWAIGGLAATASYGAYAIAVWAMTVAPIALVAALRETSILFAVLIGWLVFGERMDKQKAVAAALIVAGVIVTRL